MRKTKKPAFGNLDSLLDTMTNVVGVLVIVLVTTQLGVADAMKRIRSADSSVPATPQQVEAARDAFQKLDTSLTERRQQWEAASANADDDKRRLQHASETLKARQAEFALHDETLDEARQRRQRYVELQRLIRQEKGIADAREEEASLLRAEIDNTQPIPPKLIRLPDPRPAPPDANATYFVCRRDRVTPFNAVRLFEEMYRGIRRALGGRELKSLSDLDTIADYFDRKEIGDEFFRIRIKNLTLDLLIKFELRTGQRGTARESIRDTSSQFARTVEQADSSEQYFRFFVWPDSFDAYLEARRLTDEAGFSAGWVAYEQATEIQMLLGNSSDGGPTNVVD